MIFKNKNAYVHHSKIVTFFVRQITKKFVVAETPASQFIRERYLL